MVIVVVRSLLTHSSCREGPLRFSFQSFPYWPEYLREGKWVTDLHARRPARVVEHK
jgi:hypothetical protein